jgi:very-short-patch-repair endonuclease
VERGGGALVASRPNVDRARKLRRAMTLPEVLLWQVLRGRPNGIKFRRQHPVGGYVADFACLSSRLLIEVDGEVHEHDSIARIDGLRQNDLESHGYAVLRIAARDVLNELDGVVRMIVAECSARTPLHQPAAGPPPRPGEDLR